MKYSSRKLISRVNRIMVKLREQNRLTPAIWDSGSFTLPINRDGHPDYKALVWYPTPGCSWAKKGGCTVCNFGEQSHYFKPDEIVKNFNQHLSSFDPGLSQIHIGPGGSFFDNETTPPDVRLAVIKSLSQFHFLQSVSVEARPESIEEEQLLDVIDNLPENVQEFKVGFGLESSTDFVRKVAFNKGNSLQDLQKTIDIIKELDKTVSIDLGFDCYVLLKPPFLSESEAIDDTVKSVEWAFNAGADTVAIFINTIKDGTLCDYLHKDQSIGTPLHFETPYYRSMVEVLKLLHPDIARKCIVLGLVSGIPPHTGPRGCHLCKTFLSGTLIAHNYYRDQALINIASQSVCACKSKWQEELQMELPPIEQRIDNYLSHIEQRLGLSPKGANR